MGDIGQQPNIQAESRQLCKLDLGKNYSFQIWFLSDQPRHLRDIIAWQDLAWAWEGNEEPRISIDEHMVLQWKKYGLL
jgi:hypothetical protein